jgi:hypothetical protein
MVLAMSTSVASEQGSINSCTCTRIPLETHSLLPASDAPSAPIIVDSSIGSTVVVGGCCWRLLLLLLMMVCAHGFARRQRRSREQLNREQRRIRAPMHRPTPHLHTYWRHGCSSRYGTRYEMIGRTVVFFKINWTHMGFTYILYHNRQRPGVRSLSTIRNDPIQRAPIMHAFRGDLLCTGITLRLHS